MKPLLLKEAQFFGKQEMEKKQKNKLKIKMKYFFLLTIVLVMMFNLFKHHNYSNKRYHTYLVIEKSKVEKNGRKYKIYVKVFDSKNRIVLYKEGNFNTTDSIIYRYTNNIVESFEYKPDENRKLIFDSSDKEVYIENFSGKEIVYKDTFNLYDDINFKEVERLYIDRLSISKKSTNSEFIYKYHYNIKGEKIFMLLPFISNNRGTEEADELDSLNVYCSKEKIIKEEYFFKDKLVRKEYSYELERLVKVKNEVIAPDYKDYFFEEFKYKYVNSWL
jgi:hypothetical protein